MPLVTNIESITTYSLKEMHLVSMANTSINDSEMLTRFIYVMNMPVHFQINENLNKHVVPKVIRFIGTLFVQYNTLTLIISEIAKINAMHFKSKTMIALAMPRSLIPTFLIHIPSLQHSLIPLLQSLTPSPEKK
jgi:hypothetical protein